GEAGHADLGTRIAIAFWHAAERAARELSGAEIEAYGQVAGALAVRCKPLDAHLVQVLLDETWSSRPLLDGLEVQRRFEVVEGVDAPFAEEAEAPLPENGAALTDPPPTGPSLPEAAVRLGLALHDLVALLHDRGLPFSDDKID